jgi:hypothetical protein
MTKAIDKTRVHGACLCGAVSLSLIPKQGELHACHCSQCRQWTGSAFVEIDAAKGTLKYNDPVKSYTSSDSAERASCDTCGSTLWYKVTVPGKEHYSVAAGLFENAGNFALAKEIYIDCKPSGYTFSGDHLKQTKSETEALFATFGDEEKQ